MAQITAAIVNQLAAGAKDVLQQAAAVATGNQGDYIANGQPESIYGKIQQATARQYCRRYADDPGALPGAVGVVVENICRPYLGAIGYGTAPEIRVPFDGGQCDEIYLVTLRGTQGNGVVGGPFTRRVHGPIGGARFANEDGTFRGQLFCRAINNNANNCGPIVPAELAWRGVGLSGQGFNGGTLEILNIVPCDGTDQCGSPPPEILPPGPPPTPGPRRERYNPGPDIDIDIDIEINPDGSFDVDFGIGPVTVDPFPEPSPGDEPGGPTGPPPGDVGAPGGPVETGPGSPGGEGGDAEGEAPPGSVLTGLRLEVLSVPDQRKRFTPEVLRGVCYVYMGVPGLLDHDPAGAMLTDDQFVFAEKENLTAWRVRANFGYNIRVTPYYREVE